MALLEEALLEEIRQASPKKREAILSHACYVPYVEDAVSEGLGEGGFVPFENYQEVDDFLEYHQRHAGVIQ